MTFANDDEEALTASQDFAFCVAEFGLVEEFSAFTADVVTDQGEWLVEWRGVKVVDLKVAGHGQQLQWAVELAHGLVEQSGNNAAVDISGWALVQ